MNICQCPGCRAGWGLFPPVAIKDHSNLFRCIECKRVYRITIEEVPERSSALQWQNLPYGMKGQMVDIPDLGRYVVRPETKFSRTWRAYLNSARTVYSGSRDECKVAVERVVEQWKLDHDKTS